MSVAEICREMGISQPTFYQWKRNYSGMEVKPALGFNQKLSHCTIAAAQTTDQGVIEKPIWEL